MGDRARVLEAYKTVSLLYSISNCLHTLIVLEAYKTVSLLYIDHRNEVFGRVLEAYKTVSLLYADLGADVRGNSLRSLQNCKPALLTVPNRPSLTGS